MRRGLAPSNLNAFSSSSFRRGWLKISPSKAFNLLTVLAAITGIVFLSTLTLQKIHLLPTGRHERNFEGKPLTRGFSSKSTELGFPTRQLRHSSPWNSLPVGEQESYFSNSTKDHPLTVQAQSFLSLIWSILGPHVLIRESLEVAQHDHQDHRILLPPELQQPETNKLIGTLYQTWLLLKDRPETFSSEGIEGSLASCLPPHVISALNQIEVEVSKLPGHACQRSLVSEDYHLPYVLLRRMTIATMTLVPAATSLQPSQNQCLSVTAKVMDSVLISFAAAFNCSRTFRQTMQLLHISKAGGTSMCQLAAESKLYNPKANMMANCMVPKLYDEPRWTRLQQGQDSKRLWPAVKCPQWLNSPAVNCGPRVQQLKEMGITFASNEASLHSGTSQLGSAHACPGLETVVVLRNGAQRSQSHIAEVIRVYKRISRGAFRYHTPVTLEDWKTFAPAVVDNYMTRFLIGRHYMHCRDFGTLGEPELLAASLALSSIDHVLVLGQDDLNDVVMKAGMGWSSGLRSKRWRWASQGDLEKDYGFRNGSKAILEEWNHLDQKLLTWGSLILKLDALFHGGVAAVSGHLRRSAWQQASAGEQLLEQSMNSDSPRGGGKPISAESSSVILNSETRHGTAGQQTDGIVDGPITDIHVAIAIAHRRRIKERDDKKDQNKNGKAKHGHENESALVKVQHIANYVNVNDKRDVLQNQLVLPCSFFPPWILSALSSLRVMCLGFKGANNNGSVDDLMSQELVPTFTCQAGTPPAASDSLLTSITASANLQKRGHKQTSSRKLGAVNTNTSTARLSNEVIVDSWSNSSKSAEVGSKERDVIGISSGLLEPNKVGSIGDMSLLFCLPIYTNLQTSSRYIISKSIKGIRSAAHHITAN